MAWLLGVILLRFTLSVPCAFAATFRAAAARPMNPFVLVGLQQLVSEQVVLGTPFDADHVQIAAITGLKSESVQDLHIASSLNEQLISSLGDPFRLTTLRGPDARKSACQSACAGYGQASNTVADQMRERLESVASRVTAREMTSAALAAATSHLSRYAFYDAGTPESVLALQAMKFAARRDQTMRNARVLAAAVLSGMRSGRPLDPGEIFVPGHDRVLAPRAIPATRLEGDLAAALSANRLTISDATNADGQAVGSFINGIRAGELGIEESWHNFEQLGDPDRHDGFPGKIVVVRDERSRIIATAGYSPVGQRHGICELQMVYVAREWRKSKKVDPHCGGGDGRFDLARALVLLMMLNASRAGYDGMALDTRVKSMHTALKLYSGLGFLPSSKSLAHQLTVEQRQRLQRPGELMTLFRDIQPDSLLEEFRPDFSFAAP